MPVIVLDTQEKDFNKPHFSYLVEGGSLPALHDNERNLYFRVHGLVVQSDNGHASNMGLFVYGGKYRLDKWNDNRKYSFYGTGLEFNGLIRCPVSAFPEHAEIGLGGYISGAWEFGEFTDFRRKDNAENDYYFHPGKYAGVIAMYPFYRQKLKNDKSIILVCPFGYPSLASPSPAVTFQNKKTAFTITWMPAYPYEDRNKRGHLTLGVSHIIQ